MKPTDYLKEKIEKLNNFLGLSIWNADACRKMWDEIRIYEDIQQHIEENPIYQTKYKVDQEVWWGEYEYNQWQYYHGVILNMSIFIDKNEPRIYCNVQQANKHTTDKPECFFYPTKEDAQKNCEQE